ncbi:MAG: permease-like cell division protein FtsX [Zoogloeaceae bacterium]|jgi:cell division transport system permease protein|nr:permease-like cell division protein FtsX [Zoogloeaceae bacterium]
MKTWLRQHRAALGHALQRLWRAPLNTLLSLVVIGIAMTLPAAGYILLDNVQKLGVNASGVQEISVFMRTDASDEMTGAVEAALAERFPGQWRFVSRAVALESLKTREGMADIVESLPQNPLPDAFVVEPQASAPKALESLKDSLAALPGVAHVQLDSAWIQRFDALLRLGRLIVSLLAAVFAVGLVAITFNTIRLQVLARADEIEVARLIGATDAFIRRPFYYSGILQGGLGGLAAGALILLGLAALQAPVERLASLYGSDFALTGLALRHFALLPLIGAFLGWIGAQISVSLALRQMEQGNA